MRIGFKIELNFHDLHKNPAFIDKCLWMKYEKPNESEYNENAWYKDKMMSCVYEKYTLM